MVVLTIISAIIYFVKSPSSSSSWSLGNDRSPSVKINSDQVQIKNYRDIDWAKINKTPSNSKLAQKQIEQAKVIARLIFLCRIQTLKVALSHFSAISEIAHLFILFELKIRR